MRRGRCPSSASHRGIPPDRRDRPFDSLLGALVGAHREDRVLDAPRGRSERLGLREVALDALDPGRQVRDVTTDPEDADVLVDQHAGERIPHVSAVRRSRPVPFSQHAADGYARAMRRPQIGIPLTLDDRGRWRTGRHYHYIDRRYADAIDGAGGLAVQLPIQSDPEALVNRSTVC